MTVLLCAKSGYDVWWCVCALLAHIHVQQGLVSVLGRLCGDRY